LINSKRGQQILLPLGFLALSYFIYDTFFSTPSVDSVVARGKETDLPVAAENVFTADQFWATCTKDNGAGNKFKDNFVQVSGKIKKVLADKGHVYLECPSTTNSIVCSFGSKEDVAGLKAGEDVTIQGEGGGGGKANTDVMVIVCRIKKK